MKRSKTNGHTTNTNTNNNGRMLLRSRTNRKGQRRMIFSININGNIVDWSYNLDCQDKQYHKTWIPKLRDIQIITKDLNSLTISEVKKIILEDIQPDITMVKEHNNKLARARRMGI
jgi:hypothetical protein